MKKKRLVYESPALEIYLFSARLNILSEMSLGGDIKDYEEGGEYEGTYSNTPI